MSGVSGKGPRKLYFAWVETLTFVKVFATLTFWITLCYLLRAVFNQGLLNQSHRQCSDQSKFEDNTRSWCEGRENVCKQAANGSGLTSDWLGDLEWREFFKPINERKIQTQSKPFY